MKALFFLAMNSPLRIGINGFGRIGRNFTRLIINNPSSNLIIVAINDPGDLESLAHLLEFDSIHGRLHGVDIADGGIRINGHFIPVSHERSISAIDWRIHQVDLVLESSGKFKRIDELKAHLESGAPRVLLSAVGSDEAIKTIVLGANEDLIIGDEWILSNASCTTNCAAPLVDVVDRHFSIESGYITTVHSYTSDQSLHDRPHRDLRRARAAAVSIIPTTTGAAKAITKIYPKLDGFLGGAGIRVPVPNGSLTDVTYIVGKQTTVEEVNQAFKSAAENEWKHRLEYTTKPLVSIDIVGNTHSCIYDSQLTSVIGKMVKVVGWYDNEIGYASRLIDLINYWSKRWA